ncbi:hypothetical protein ABOC32_16890 [Pseudomonas sp. WOUb67]|uniref:hypothetical protein n=1 Tax=Pseudomonas sp. WOUb67 TaxID=3161136 RepID=UPI003CF7F425
MHFKCWLTFSMTSKCDTKFSCADPIPTIRPNPSSEGAAIERKHHKDIAELVAVVKRRLVIGGHDVPAASLPYTLTIDAGHLMAQGTRPRNSVGRQTLAGMDS